jgi:hypothetical protein
MNYPLLARVLLRLVAMVAVYFGLAEGQADVIATNADFIALVSLGMSEAYFYFDKARGK